MHLFLENQQYQKVVKHPTNTIILKYYMIPYNTIHFRDIAKYDPRLSPTKLLILNNMNIFSFLKFLKVNNTML